MRQKKEINIQIGEQVRLAREQSRKTQEQLAEDLDVSPQYISDLERGVVGISIATLKKLCSTLCVSSDQILFGTSAKDREAILSHICDPLSDEQFAILMEIIDKFVQAVKI